jgi:hypothetical protein
MDILESLSEKFGISIGEIGCACCAHRQSGTILYDVCAINGRCCVSGLWCSKFEGCSDER